MSRLLAREQATRDKSKSPSKSNQTKFTASVKNSPGRKRSPLKLLHPPTIKQVVSDDVSSNDTYKNMRNNAAIANPTNPYHQIELNIQTIMNEGLKTKSISNSNSLFKLVVRNILSSSNSILRCNWSFAVTNTSTSSISKLLSQSNKPNELSLLQLNETAKQFLSIWSCSSSISQMNSATMMNISAAAVQTNTLNYSNSNSTLHKLLDPIYLRRTPQFMDDFVINIIKLSGDEFRSSGLVPPDSVVEGDLMCFIFQVTFGKTLIGDPIDTCVFIYCFPAESMADSNARDTVSSSLRILFELISRLFYSVETHIGMQYCNQAVQILSSVNEEILECNNRLDVFNKLFTRSLNSPLLAFVSAIQTSVENKIQSREHVEGLFNAKKSYVIINHSAYRLIKDPSKDWYESGEGGGVIIGGANDNYYVLNEDHSAELSKRHNSLSGIAFTPVYQRLNDASSLDAGLDWMSAVFYAKQPVLVPSVSNLKHFVTTILPAANIASRGLNGGAMGFGLDEVVQFISTQSSNKHDELETMSYQSHVRAQSHSWSVESYQSLYNFIMSVDSTSNSVVLYPVYPLCEHAPDEKKFRGELCIVMISDRCISSPVNAEGERIRFNFMLPRLPTENATDGRYLGENLNSVLTSFSREDVKMTVSDMSSPHIVNNCINSSAQLSVYDKICQLWKLAISNHYTHNILIHQSRVEKRLLSIAVCLAEKVRNKAMISAFSKWAGIWTVQKNKHSYLKSMFACKYSMDIASMLNDQIANGYQIGRKLTLHSKIENDISYNQSLIRLEKYCNNLYPSNYYEVDMNYNISSSFSLDDIQRAQAAGDAIIANQFTIDAKIPDHCTTIFGLVYASNTEPLSDDVQQYQLLKRQPKAVEGSPSLVAIVRITKRKTIWLMRVMRLLRSSS